MVTSKEGFDNGFIRLNLFICITILSLMLLWLMIEDILCLLVKCRKRQVLAKVREIEMALKLVASSNVILYRYQRGFLVGTENTDNKLPKYFTPVTLPR